MVKNAQKRCKKIKIQIHYDLTSAFINTQIAVLAMDIVAFIDKNLTCVQGTGNPGNLNKPPSRSQLSSTSSRSIHVFHYYTNIQPYCPVIIQTLQTTSE